VAARGAPLRSPRGFATRVGLWTSYTTTRDTTDLERENARLKRAVAELTLDKLILKEAAEGNF
jgi:hypothetical protein